jgi:hypothetical protein
MFTRDEKNQVRRLLAHCIGNPVRRAARQARANYLHEIIVGRSSRTPAQWLERLHDLVGPHKEIEDVARWYAIETRRLEEML